MMTYPLSGAPRVGNLFEKWVGHIREKGVGRLLEKSGPVMGHFPENSQFENEDQDILGENSLEIV
jgi:hypothetical protein